MVTTLDTTLPTEIKPILAEYGVPIIITESFNQYDPGTGRLANGSGTILDAIDATPENYWDRDSSFRITASGLTSKTQLEVLNGANRIQVDSEVIGFADVEDLGSGVVRLSTLLRGLQGTQATSHAVGASWSQSLTVDHTVTATPPTSVNYSYIDGDTVKQTDLQTLILKPDFTPKQGQRVTIDTQEFRITAVKPIYSGALVLAYTLILRS